MANDIYQAVTDRILDMLDQGTVPWRHPIKGNGTGGGLPKNLQSGKPYRGVNVFLLAMTAWAKGYESAYWLTYKQAKQKGGQVRRGEKSSLVVFWKQHTVTDKETGEPKKVPVIRHYNVFNAEQCQDIEPPDITPPDPDAVPFEPIAAAEQIVSGYRNPPVIEHGGSQAFYRPGEDLVRIAEPERFEEREAYYATLFHELSHSTGHKSRLDRGLGKKLSAFGSADYSKEELVAEMGAAFLAATAGISPPTIQQSAAYIDGWRKKLKGDKKLIVQAAGAGQRAADHILGTSWDDSTSPPEPDKQPSPRVTKTSMSQIEVDPARLSSGRWSEQENREIGEGDIAASYSADLIAMEARVRKPFRHDGLLWSCVGRSTGAEAYRLTDPDSFDSLATTYREKTQDCEAARADPRGFYHGMTVSHAGQAYVLTGPPAHFVAGAVAQPGLFS